MALPPLRTTEPLQIRFCVPILQYIFSNAKCYAECYDLCRDAVTEGMNLFSCLCPPSENKANISQHNSLDTVLKYPPPKQSKISHLEKTFIQNSKAVSGCLHGLILLSQVDYKCWDRLFPYQVRDMSEKKSIELS